MRRHDPGYAGLGGVVGRHRYRVYAPGIALFHELLCGWVLCPGRRTITGIICIADPEFRHAHDAYHRLLRVGRWSMALLWHILAGQLLAALAPEGTLPLGVDDTLFHKSGRRINGAGIFRDPVRSTKNKVSTPSASIWWC